MGEAKLYGQSKSGMQLNGIVRDYYAYAGENIKAGDFVEFVNGVSKQTQYGTSSFTQITSEKSYEIFYAVLLNNENVLLLHSYGSNYYLYGIVVQINGSNITFGIDTQISSETHSAGRVVSGNTSWYDSLTADILPNGNVFVAHCTDSCDVMGTLLSISGTTISVITTKQIVSSSSGSALVTKTIALQNGNVIVLHEYTSTSYYICYASAVVCTVSDTSISAGTSTTISGYVDGGDAINGLLLPNGDVFYIHSGTSDLVMYAGILVINGTTFTNKITEQSTGYYYKATKNASLALLPNGNIFLTCANNSYYLIARILTILESSISTGTVYTLNSSSNSGYLPTAIINAPKNRVIITHRYSSTFCIVCEVNEKVITFGTDTQIVAAVGYQPVVIRSLALSNNTMICFTNYNSYIGAQIFAIDEQNNIVTTNVVGTDYEIQVHKVITGQFEGVAKTSGVGGDNTGHKDIVKVYQSNNTFNLIPDCSFEKNMWSGANYSEEKSHSGIRSLYFPAGTTYVPNIEIPRPIIGHKYYGRRYIKSNGDNQPADCRFEVWGADGANMNWVYAWNNGNHPEWNFHSAIHEITAVDYPETDRTIIRCFNVNTTVDTWVDDLLLVDLTELYGAGNEPTKEWCDKNI